MQTTLVNSASMVADIQFAIQKQQSKVNELHRLLMANLRTVNQEAYRAAWSAARAELSRLQLNAYFSQKGGLSC